MKICPNCQSENPEDAKYCNQCTYPLETPEIENPEKIIKITYFISIILGWIGIPLLILSKSTNSGIFAGFFGFLLPLNLLRSQNPQIRKHARIQTLICISGLIIQILILFY